MKAKFNVSDEGIVTDITLPEKEFSRIINKYAEERFKELKKELTDEFDIKLKSIVDKIIELSELFEKSKKLATEARGLNQKGIRENKERIQNLINTMKDGIETKIK